MQIFRGQVTNNNSPLKDGKVQVRIPGIHPDNSGFEVVEDQDLPWLEMMSGGNLHNEIGFSQVPIIGQWVHVLVPDNLDEMIVIGQVRSSVTDVNKYQKGEGTRKLEPIEVEHKSVQIQEPPELDSKTEYPNSASYNSQSNHLLMIDDTENNERIKIEHRSGQFIEFRPDGSFDLRSPKDGYTIIEGDFNQYIKGEINKIVEGQVNIAVKEQVKAKIDKEMNIDVDDNIIIHSSKEGKLTIDDKLTITIGSQILTIEDGKTTLISNSGVDITGNVNVTGKVSATDEVMAMSQSTMNKLSTHMHTGNLGAPTPIIPMT